MSWVKSFSAMVGNIELVSALNEDRLSVSIIDGGPEVLSTDEVEDLIAKLKLWRSAFSPPIPRRKEPHEFTYDIT